MADYVEKWGDSIEDAVVLALQELKVDREHVDITVLEQPSRGFFGIGRKLALVRVQKKQEEPEKPAVRVAEKPAAKTVQRETAKKENREPKHENRKEKETAKSEKSVKSAEEPAKRNSNENRTEEKHAEEKSQEKGGREKHGSRRNGRSSVVHTKFTITDEDTDAVPAQGEPSVKFIEEIARDMGIKIDVKAHIMNDIIYINLEGEDVGTMIGKRGQTLDAVQYLASIVQNKDAEKHIRVIINAEKYREKREKTLQQLARRLADKCIRSGKSIRLEPMNPYERKVIHSVLQTHAKVTTRSEGVEPNRRVIIELKK